MWKFFLRMKIKMNKSILKGKNCLVTGATGGIGKEISIQLAENSCNLFLTGRNKQKLELLKNFLNSKNPKIKIEFQEGNLTKLTDMEKIVSSAKHCFHNIDVLINCAGVFIISPISKYDVDDYSYSFNLNVRAPFVLSKEFVPDMIKKKWGRIVNLGSSSSYMGFENGSLYCSTKFAILGLSRSLHAELKKYNIRTYCISPGSTKTDMAKISVDQNFDTFLDPKEVAELINYVISFDNELVIDEIRLNRMIIE
jgi:3-oxoacyl-[acyl-carrier protein] reductase